MNTFALKRIKDLFWVLAIAGLVVGIGRFAFGLGASTNMLDSLPWGLWKIFNMVAGAALATSGFVLASVIYIVQLDRFKPVARLSIVIGFLGYGSSLTALVFDVGLPHRGWHPLFMWNPHSFLFEVFWCVSCYWSITALELVPIITERFRLNKFTHFMHEIMLPFVILGITLSTMHHSSLGSLFLASPTRLHPLWHTIWLPPEFFLSAMGAGLALIIFVSLACAWLYGRKTDMKILGALAKAQGVILLIYLVVKVIDFTVHGKWNYVFGADASWESAVFGVEILLQAIGPIAILAVPKLRKQVPWLMVASIAALIGLLMHRLDTGIVGYYRSAGQIYLPNLSEYILSFGVLSAAALIFFFLVERFHIFDAPEEEGHHDEDEAPHVEGAHGPIPAIWSRDEARTVFLGRGGIRAIFITVLIIPIAWICLKQEATGAFRPIAAPVKATIGLDPLRATLRIDGNRANEAVDFPHDKHKKELGEDASCIKCHHLSLPNDNSTACYMCHADMGTSTDIFDHDAHQERHGGDDSCATCHDPDLAESAETAKACIDCHRENMAGIEKQTLKGYSHVAAGYKVAMHGLCITCHRLKEKDPADPLGIGNCQKCHPLAGSNPETKDS